MNEVKLHIVRMAKALHVVATIAKAVTIVLMVVTGLQIAAAFSLNTPAFTDFFDGRLSDIESVLGRSMLFGFLFETANLGALDPVYQKAIELFITFLSLVVLLSYVDLFRRLIGKIISEGQPFSAGSAQQMRRSSYALLLLVLVNPVLGLLMFMLVRFFSLLVEYGAYLRDRAEATNRIQEEVIMSLAEIT